MSTENKEKFICETPANVFVGIGWDSNRDGDSSDAFDVDLCAFLLGKEGRVSDLRDLIYFKNTRSKDNSVVHSGDNVTGEGEGDDEAITVDFESVDENVSSIAFAASIYKAAEKEQNFGMLQNAYIRLYDEEMGELFRYDLSKEFPNDSAVVFGELSRDEDGKWKFSSIGDSFGGSIVALSVLYGVFSKEFVN